MLTIDVKLEDRSYPIHVGPGLLRDAGLVQSACPHRQLLLLTNTTVAPLYAEPLRAALAGRVIVEVVMADGEQHKTLATASRVLDALVANRFGRDAAVLALGGGVVGDLAGFVAAIYQRGIDFVQIPTTLLADVDSSVGGKTAVNHPGGKNLIGAFHQPRAVVIDTDVLGSLPAREIQAGLAEIIKYGLICDPKFFAWLEAHVTGLRRLDGADLTHAIAHSCRIKADFVRRDEREQGERALLNLGHTFGHAIESATGYTEWLHGEAVGTGLAIAADMSRRMGLLRGADVDRVRALLGAAGLERAPPKIGVEAAMKFMGLDKKVRAGRVRLVLLRQIGEAFLTADYPDEALRDTLATWFGK